MSTLFEASYSLPGSDEPLTHARIAHSNNWVSGGTASASTTDSDYFEDGPENSLTYEKWKPTSSTSTWTYTFSSQTVDYFCIGAHTLGSSGCTISVTLNGSTTAIPSTAITNDSPIFCIFEPRAATSIRINISGGTPVIGVMKVGAALQMPQPLYGGHVPINLARAPEMRSVRSATGEFLGRTKIRMFNRGSFAWSELTAAWVRDNWPLLQQAIETEPFFIAWRPDPNNTSTKDEVGFGDTSVMPIPQNQGVRDFMSVSMEMTGYGYD